MTPPQHNLSVSWALTVMLTLVCGGRASFTETEAERRSESFGRTDPAGQAPFLVAKSASNVAFKRP